MCKSILAEALDISSGHESDHHTCRSQERHSVEEEMVRLAQGVNSLCTACFSKSVAEDPSLSLNSMDASGIRCRESLWD